MDSIHPLVLQRELARIENEARNKSLAIMHKADDLADAIYLCSLINDGLPIDQQIGPSVMYFEQGTSAEVSIYVPIYGVQVLRRAAEIELTWDDNGDAYAEMRDLRFHSFERIEVRVKASAVNEHLESLKTAA